MGRYASIRRESSGHTCNGVHDLRDIRSTLLAADRGNRNCIDTMEDLEDWATRWRIPLAAVIELRRSMTTSEIRYDPGTSEAAVQSQVRLEASRKGCRLWRNNVGAGYLQDGTFVRWGLANDSKKMNDAIKSSDLIGIRPVDIGGGRIIGQFVAREVKHSGWKFKGDNHEKAQLRFLEIVNGLGGDGKFAVGEGTL